jgi:hypothetical protein
MSRSLVALLCVLFAGMPADGGVPPEEHRIAPSLVGPLPFFYDFYTFRGADGGTLGVAAVAVEAGELKREREEDEVRYRFDVSVVLADTALRSVTRTDDSVFVAAPRALPGEHLLFTQLEVETRPSASTVQRVIMTDATRPGIGQLYDSAFPIPDYSGSELMISDIALGRPDAEAGWRRGDITLALLPTSQFPRSAFEVYYEVYNLPPGHRYTTELVVQPRDQEGGDAEEPVRLRFSGEAEDVVDGALQELRRVEAYLPRGAYRLTVTLTNEETGETARRSRTFEVRGWEPGATLVAALPR